MNLNKDNYFSQEANKAYMSVSQFKAFEKCVKIIVNTSAVGFTKVTSVAESKVLLVCIKNLDLTICE